MLDLDSGYQKGLTAVGHTICGHRKDSNGIRSLANL